MKKIYQLISVKTVIRSTGEEEIIGIIVDAYDTAELAKKNAKSFTESQLKLEGNAVDYFDEYNDTEGYAMPKIPGFRFDDAMYISKIKTTVSNGRVWMSYRGVYEKDLNSYGQ